jgi:hypothetical protein
VEDDGGAVSTDRERTPDHVVKVLRTGVDGSAISEDGCARAVDVAFLILPGLAASAFVWGQARGEYVLDIADDACVVLLLWMSLPVINVVLWRRVRFRWNAGICVVAAAVSLGVTLWVVRPQAPDGSSYDTTYEEAVRELEADLRQGLDEAVPGQWAKEPGISPDPCVDQFGRSRGAVHGVDYYELEVVLTRPQFEALLAVVGRSDRDVEAPRFGRPVHLDGADTKRMGIRLDDAFGDGQRSRIELFTPCLRSTGG